MSDRPKGRMVYSSPPNPIADAAKKHQEQLQRQHQQELAARRQRTYDTMPNRVCYANSAFAGWEPGVPIPRCNRCHGKLHPEEHHSCPGFVPRYDTRGLSREEKIGMRRAGWDDWDDDQFDPTTPGDADPLRHEAETSETRDQVVIERMTEEEWLMNEFGYIPSSEDFEE